MITISILNSHEIVFFQDGHHFFYSIMNKIQQFDRQPQRIHEPQVFHDPPLTPKTLMDSGLNPANTIDEWLLNQEKLLKEKDFEIEEQN